MHYDVITVGGGIAGSTLAKNLAEHGYRVLVLERETHSRDRVRGEQMHPWGVAEVRRGVKVEAVVPGCPPSVRVQEDGQDRVLQARLVVGADGRASPVRRWAGFTVNQDPDCHGCRLLQRYQYTPEDLPARS